MRPKRRARQRRAGLSLLEMLVVAAMTGSLMAATTVVVRGAYAAWQAHETDLDRVVAADAVLRHIVRNIRQAVSVASISAATDDTGSLTLEMPDAAQHTWSHAGDAAGTVQYDSANGLLATGITALRFAGFEADGLTATSTPADVQLVRTTVVVAMPAGGGSLRTLSCNTWVRSW